MNKESSEKLIEIINFYKNNLNSEDKSIREFSKLKYDNYVNFLKKYSINSEQKINENEDKNLLIDEYIDNICKNKDIKNKLEDYKKTLKNDFSNLNDELINTWVNSYKDFVNKNNLDKKKMISYANDLIKSFDTNLKYSIAEDFNLIKQEEKNIEESYDSFKQSKENQQLKDTNNEKDVQNKNDQEKKNTKDSISKNQEEEELKIISHKKGKHSKKDIAILTGISLASVGLLGLPVGGTIAILYILNKFKDTIKYKFKINSLLKKYNLTQNEDNTITDEDGKIIDSKYIDKKMYNMIKQELIKLENDLSKGKIKKSYKKNKLTSKLLNNKVVVNLKNKLKFKEEVEEQEETQDIKKGLGAIK